MLKNPSLFEIVGQSGVGKTTFCEMLSRESDKYVIFEIDKWNSLYFHEDTTVHQIHRVIDTMEAVSMKGLRVLAPVHAPLQMCFPSAVFPGYTIGFAVPEAVMLERKARRHKMDQSELCERYWSPVVTRDIHKHCDCVLRDTDDTTGFNHFLATLTNSRR